MAVSVSARTVGLIVAAVFVGTWFGATVTENVAREQAARVPPGARPVGSPHAVVVPTETLRKRLAEPPLPARGRNPFVYAPRTPARSAVRDRSPEPEATQPLPIPFAPPTPVVRLSGIASDTKDGATTFTAILNDNGAIVLAKAGDKLSNGYSVVRVEETSVTLVDANGVTQTIRLP
jgi:hypothetical protein